MGIKKLYKKITPVQKVISLSLILISIICLCIIEQIEIDAKYTFESVFVSIAASALYSLIYSALAKNIESKEIVENILTEVYPVIPYEIYEASSERGEKFINDLTKELNVMPLKYYYEGNSITSASHCLETCLKGQKHNVTPDIKIIIGKMTILEKKMD